MSNEFFPYEFLPHELCPLLSLEEAALVTSLPLSIILRGIGEHTLPYRFINGHYRIQLDDLLHFKEIHGTED